MRLKDFLTCHPCTRRADPCAQPSCEKMQQANLPEPGPTRELTGISVGHSKQRKTKAGPEKNWGYGDALLL